MNWTDKAAEIAEKLLLGAQKGLNGQLSHSDLKRLLETAARKGMEHKCDCWINKTR